MKVLRDPTGPLGVNTYYGVCENTGKGFLVDPGGYDHQLAEKIKEEGTTLEYIILTHGHFDHVGGVPEFMKEFPEAKLVVSRQEKEINLLPDILIEGGEVLCVGELKLEFMHTPGHSPGSLCILVEDILFSGDTLFQQSVGRTDFPGSSFASLERSIREKLYVLPDDTNVLPGHMGETEIGFEKRNNPFVRYSADRG